MIDGGSNQIGYKHSEESIQKMKDNRNGLTSGNKNSMFGISMLQRMINKHGEEIGKIKYEEWKEKEKLVTTGINNPRYRHDITQDKVNEFKQKGYSNKEIARILGCSSPIINKRLK